MAQAAVVGDTVDIGLFVVSDGMPQTQTLAAAEVILGWDPGVLQLLGLNNTGAVPLLSSVFHAGDVSGLNEVSPPQDGDGLYSAFANFGQPVIATMQGVLLTTFQYRALAPTLGTLVDILPTAGNPPINTTVFDGVVPNLDVTGTLGSAAVTIIPEPGTLALLALGAVALRIRRRKRDL